MKKFYTLAAVISSMAIATTAYADGIHIGYCDGVIATASTGTVTGQSGNDATIEEAIFLPPSQLAAYTTCQLTSIYAGLAKNAPQYPEQLTGWYRTEKEGENIASGTITSSEGGWNLITLDEALNVADYAETGIWVGFTYTQPKKLNVIAIGGEAYIDDACWIAKNGKWSNYNRYGVLPIEAIVEGDDLPRYDLTLISTTIRPNIIKLGSEIKVKATIKNNALADAVNPVINYSIANGAITGSYTVQQTLTYREKATVSFAIPADGITEECDATAEFELTWGDGTADQYAADNTSSNDLSFAKDVFTKRMLVEEGTGSWCGWCVRGLVGLKEMRENYPDQFIGIGVHDGDIYTISSYDKWMAQFIDGYPGCVINRDGSNYDPNFELLESYLLNMDPIASGDVDLTCTLGETIDVDAAVSFSINGSNHYNITFVVLEDQLPITQSNYYSGGGYGEMGGFEDLPSKADVLIDDVARTVYPEIVKPANLAKNEKYYTGMAIDAPAEIVKGEVYITSVSIPMPTLADVNNCALVAILTDTETQEVVNANKISLVPQPEGIEEVRTIATDTHCYNLAGQRIATPAKGFFIINGKKAIIR